MYKLTKNKETGKFEVYEEATEQVISSFSNHKDAHKVYRKLSGGQGFCGWTPSFMLFGDWQFKG